MKKKLITILVLTAIATAMLLPAKAALTAWQTWTSIVAAERSTGYSQWHSTATISDTAAEPSALGVTERTYTTITAAIAANVQGDGKIIVFQVPYGANAVRVRAAGTADATLTTDILTGCTGTPANANFEVNLRGTLAWVMGTQATAVTGFVFADECTLTADSASTSAWTIADPGDGTNLPAEAMIDLQGDNVIVIVPTTLDGDAKLILKFY